MGDVRNGTMSTSQTDNHDKQQGTNITRSFSAPLARRVSLFHSTASTSPLHINAEKNKTDNLHNNTPSSTGDDPFSRTSSSAKIHIYTNGNKENKSPNGSSTPINNNHSPFNRTPPPALKSTSSSSTTSSSSSSSSGSTVNTGEGHQNGALTLEPHTESDPSINIQPPPASPKPIPLLNALRREMERRQKGENPPVILENTARTINHPSGSENAGFTSANELSFNGKPSYDPETTDGENNFIIQLDPEDPSHQPPNQPLSDSPLTEPVTPEESAACATLKSLPRGLLAIIASFTPGIMAFANPLGTTPIDFTADTIKNATWQQLGLAFTDGISSLLTNAFQNNIFLRDGWAQFQKNRKESFTLNSAAMLGGLGAAVAAFAIGYASLVALGMEFGIANGSLGFLITFAGRYLGTVSVLNRFYNKFFNADAARQAEYADLLQHVFISNENDATPNFRANAKKLNRLFDEALEALLENKLQNHPNIRASLLNGTPLTDQQFEKVKKCTSLDNENMEIILENYLDKLLTLDIEIVDKTHAEKVASAAASTFDYTLAIGLVAAPVAPIFLQKGYEGFKIILGWASVFTDEWNVWAKRALGALPSLVNATMYADWGMRSREIWSQTAKHVYESYLHNNKKIFLRDVFSLIFTAGITGFAAASSENLAKGVINNPNNIVGLTPNLFGQAMAMETRGGGGYIVNGGTNLRTYIISLFEKHGANIKRDDVLQFFSNTDHLIKKQSLLTKFSQFKQNHVPQDNGCWNTPEPQYTRIPSGP
jgi:hypothetical protein